MSDDSHTPTGRLGGNSELQSQSEVIMSLPGTPSKRAAKLAVRQREHRQLLSERKPLIAEYNRAHRALLKHNKRIADVGHAIYDLKQNGQTPEVTDHAIVRYLERIKGIDIAEIKAEVANNKWAKKVDNVIVTVNSGDDDE